MKTVIFDVDGVLTDFTLGFRALANRHFGVPVYDQNQQRTWDMEDLTPAQDNFLWSYIKDTEGFWENLTLPAEADYKDIDRISLLCQRTDRNVYFVTSRVGDTAKIETERWLRSHLGITFPTVIISARKHNVADALKADFSIDDKFENAVSMGFTNRKMKSFLMDRTYNQGFESTHFTRVTALSDYLAAVE